VKDIGKDLEIFIKYPDGGARVQGRWGALSPNTREGRREGWKRQYLTEHPDPLTQEPYQYGTPEARETLARPEARAWLDERMEAKTRLGTPLRPEGVSRYTARLGKSGLDYRVIRIARTETAEALASRQMDLARNSLICDGMVDWVLKKGRDGWNCHCAEYAAGGPYHINDLPASIPVHPNCDCELRPHLLTDAEIKARLDQEDRENL
jgi:hypothetical protein